MNTSNKFDVGNSSIKVLYTPTNLGLPPQSNKYDPNTSSKEVGSLLSDLGIQQIVDDYLESLGIGNTLLTGWTPILAVEYYEQGDYLKIVDWVGGNGEKPTVNLYIGATGLVVDIADAVNIKGSNSNGMSRISATDEFSYLEDKIVAGDNIDVSTIGISTNQSIEIKTILNPTFDTVTFDNTKNLIGNEPVGTTGWDTEAKTLSTVMEDGVIGQHFQELWFEVENPNTNEGAFSNGTLVAYAGTTGNSGKIKGQFGQASLNYQNLGIATQDISIGEHGKVTYFGKVRGINTLGSDVSEVWADGDILYAHPSIAGKLTKTIPNAPEYVVPVAIVIHAHSNGTLFVRPTFSTKLTDLADVNGTPLTTNGQILVWNEDSGVFDFTANINDFTPSIVTDAKVKDILEFDGTDWVNTENDELNKYGVGTVETVLITTEPRLPSGSGANTIGQSFTLLTDATLTKLEIYFGGVHTVALNIYAGQNITGTSLGGKTTYTTVANAYNEITFDAPITLTAGQYSFIFTSGTFADLYRGTAYSGGAAYYGFGWQADDFYFKLTGALNAIVNNATLTTTHLDIQKGLIVGDLQTTTTLPTNDGIVVVDTDTGELQAVETLPADYITVDNLPFNGTTVQESLDNISNAIINTKGLTGFIDGDNIGISYNFAAKTVTLTGNLTYLFRGVEKTLGNGSTWTSPAHVDATGAFFLRDVDGNGFTWSNTPWVFSDAMAAYVYHTTGNASLSFCIKETHGIMDFESHEEFHSQIGTYKTSGGNAVAGSYVLNSNLNANIAPLFDSAVLKDEDVSTTVNALAIRSYSLMYVQTNSVSTFIFNNSYPLFADGDNQWIYLNTASSGAWAATNTSNRYYNIYQIMMPVASDSDSQQYRMVFLQPQVAYTSLATAQGEDVRTLSLGTLTNLSPEFNVYARLTYLATNANNTYGKVELANITYNVGNRAGSVSIAGFTGNDHPALTNLVWANSGHIGTINRLASFGATGETTYTDPNIFAILDTPSNTFTGDMTISGNLTVNGSKIIQNTEESLIKDNIIIINSGESGAGVTAGIAGFIFDRGSSVNYGYIFDESDGLCRIGQYESLSGTTVSSTNNTIVLDSNASIVDDTYNGKIIKVFKTGIATQYRTISDYVGSTKTATISVNWISNPNNTFGYDIQEVVNNTQAIATRQDSPTSNGIAYWNNTLNRFDTTLTPSVTTLTSTQITGTAPFIVASTTKVTNLNADSVDGIGITSSTSGRVPFLSGTNFVDSAIVTEGTVFAIGTGVVAGSRLTLQAVSDASTSGSAFLRLINGTATNDSGMKVGAFAGVGDAGYAWIQAIDVGVGFNRNLVLQQSGGKVIIGGTTGNDKFNVFGSIYSDTSYKLKGNGTGVTTISSANSSTSNYTLSLPNVTGTLAPYSSATTATIPIWSSGLLTDSNLTYSSNRLVHTNNLAGGSSAIQSTNTASDGGAGIEVVGNAGGGFFAYYGTTYGTTAPQQAYRDKVVLGANNNASGLVLFAQEGIEFKIIETANVIKIDNLGITTFNNATVFLGQINPYEPISSTSYAVFTTLTLNTVPTSDSGLTTGQLYTQTLTELGLSGTQKVLLVK